jgi:ribosomal protein L22
MMEEKLKAIEAKSKKKIEEQTKQQQNTVMRGSLAPSSLFSDSFTIKTETNTEMDPRVAFEERDLSNMSQALNPNPKARERWHRRMIMRHVRAGGRLTREMEIARSERIHLAKSHFFKTSMKKLSPLARQIAGKPIEDAILQMRFSKKKVAEDIRKHLLQARDEAVVVRGMGLPEQPTESTDSTTSSKTKEPGQTNIYVAEAWANKGPYGREPEYRARGRQNMLRPPYTGISVRLKEEKTRTRERSEKEARALKKRLGKNMWTHLPDRPITAQRQHVLW